MADESSATTDIRYVGKREFWVFGMAAFGEGMIYTAMSSYISDFYLNVMHLAPLFVMLLMLFARVWDAINDPIMGAIADRLDSKRGKYKPYVIYAVVPIGVLTFLMFYAPPFAIKGGARYSEDAALAYVATTYVLWGMIFTVSDVPFWSMPNAMTPNADERGKVISSARLLNGVGSAIPMAIVILLGFLKPHGRPISSETKYIVMASISSVCGCLMFVACYFTTKERIKIPRPVRDANWVNPLRLIFSCRPLVLVILMGILSSGRYMLQAASIHVSRYAFRLEGMDVAESQSVVLLVLNLFSAAGMFGSMLAVPFLIKKFSYKFLLLVSCAIGAAASVAGYFACVLTDFDLWAFAPFLLISSVPLGAVNVLGHAFVGDCLDYMELKTGRRATALGAACQSFLNKLGACLGTVAVIATYMIIGLDVEAVTATTGSEFVDPRMLAPSMRTGMLSLITLVPAASLALCCVPMLFYRIAGKAREQMILDLAKARAERGVVIERDEPIAESASQSRD